MPNDWHDINLPRLIKTKTLELPQTSEPESTSDQKEPEPTEFKLEKAYWKEGTEGFRFNKKCIVVVEGKFLRKTIRTRILGNLWCESEAGLEDLGHQVQGFADEKSGKAEIEVMLYFGTRYYDLLRSQPDAKCKFYLKQIRHSRGDKEIESEPLEMPRTDVLGLGGISIKIVDGCGVAVTDRKVQIKMAAEELHNDTLADGTFTIDNKASALFTVKIENGEQPFTLDIPWQRPPLLEHRIVLPVKEQEEANV